MGGGGRGGGRTLSDEMHHYVFQLFPVQRLMTTFALVSSKFLHKHHVQVLKNLWKKTLINILISYKLQFLFVWKLDEYINGIVRSANKFSKSQIRKFAGLNFLLDLRTFRKCDTIQCFN
jgi:hypothetical protein